MTFVVATQFKSQVCRNELSGVGSMQSSLLFGKEISASAVYPMRCKLENDVLESARSLSVSFSHSKVIPRPASPAVQAFNSFASSSPTTHCNLSEILRGYCVSVPSYLRDCNCDCHSSFETGPASPVALESIPLP